MYERIADRIAATVWLKCVRRIAEQDRNSHIHHDSLCLVGAMVLHADASWICRKAEAVEEYWMGECDGMEGLSGRLLRG